MEETWKQQNCGNANTLQRAGAGGRGYSEGYIGGEWHTHIHIHKILHTHRAAFSAFAVFEAVFAASAAGAAFVVFAAFATLGLQQMAAAAASARFTAAHAPFPQL